MKETKADNIMEATYFSDTGIYDFGPLLVFRKDKRFDLSKKENLSLPR